MKKKLNLGEENMSIATGLIDDNNEVSNVNTLSHLQEESNEFDDIDINKIIAKQNKEFNSVVGKLSDYVIEQSDTPIIHTGIPIMDIGLGGGIPSKRMSYFWGASGTGKTTLCFEIAYHNFLRLAYTKKSDDWRFIFLDSEEGESTKWLSRIGINFPYKRDVPDNIEDIEHYLNDLKKSFAGQELFVIWDSVGATSAKNPTGRADIARAVSTLLNHLKLSELDITFLVINQHREKQEQYAPPVPPGGNHLRHKSHLTMHAPGIAKSDFWKEKKNGRSILWKTQKTRDSFNDVEFRMEMTYFSGYDSILTLIHVMNKQLKILKRKVDDFKIEVDKDDLSFKSGDSESKQEFTVAYADIADWDLPKKEFNGLKNLYNFFLTQESLPYWKFMLRYFAYQTFRPYFVFNENQFTPFFESTIQNIEEYYFSNWSLFVKTIPTHIKL